MTPSPASWKPPDDAPCTTWTRLGATFIADRGTPGYDDARTALAACSTCPHLTPCATQAVANNERWGIWGGTSTARRRALRRHWDTPRWNQALAAHTRRLTGQPPEPGDDELLRTGSTGRTCGARGAFAVGCRCDACSIGANAGGQLAGAARGRNLAAAVATRAALEAA